MDTLKKNLEILKKEIDESMELAQRTDQVLLVGVTKTFPVDVITDGLNLGIFDVGENKAQEFYGKYDIIRDKVNWHFIGHLQKNKVKYVIGKAKLIHSVDSFELAEEISKRSIKLALIQDVLIEVNVSGEESKFGVMKENIIELLNKISGLEGIRVRGLMTMAPNVDDETIVRDVFKGLRLLKEEIANMNISNIHMDYLSMGMSQDFKWAILEGANIIRVGSSLYGKR
ncbi:MAG: pyridoxal phosphate enzyme YggS family [Fusobacteria bacterium]|nr:MAG: pyridoxal phosphate enzyme YggS family [Fusobacteriota bacterium]KAF0229934.1 MAG: pyridoxal phosphate enzyme YggS [Fusobacteriota bacterium]